MSTENNQAEVVNDTDGGNQVTNVTVNVVVPMFCWMWPFWFPTGISQQPK